MRSVTILIGLAAVIAAGMAAPAHAVLLQYNMTGYTTAAIICPPRLRAARFPNPPRGD